MTKFAYCFQDIYIYNYWRETQLNDLLKRHNKQLKEVVLTLGRVVVPIHILKNVIGKNLLKKIATLKLMISITVNVIANCPIITIILIDVLYIYHFKNS